jgi:NAD(P)-dependent dehydrogenase (short-subunit alcohol dehydrogenase family)
VLSPERSGYQVTKFSLLRYTVYIMVDHGDKGILAYCVNRGAVLTEIALGMPKALHVKVTDRPGLVADTIVFLTKERREWLVGMSLSCNWGMPVTR